MGTMKRLLGQSRKNGTSDSITGTVRADADPLRLAKRLRKGDIAVLDVMDIDQRTAETIAARRPAAVLNARESISGRYPNGGPEVLTLAEIPLVDRMGSDVLALREGTRVRIEGNAVFRDESKVAEGTRMTAKSVAKAMEAATEGMNVQLAAFTANAMDNVSRDAGLILEGKGLPEITLEVANKQVVVLSAGFGYEERLKKIRGYLRDRRPLIIAIGEAADAAMTHAYPPEIIVGNTEHVSEEALAAAAEVVLHDPGNEAGAARLDSLNVRHITSDLQIASEDLAILLAHAGGANAIVTVGVQSSLLDFLEQGRPETAGTFLTRLVAGGRLVDSTTLENVYKHRYSPWTLVALVLSAVVVLGNAVAITPGGSAWFQDVWPTVASWFGGSS